MRSPIFLVAFLLAFNAGAAVNVTLVKRRYSAEVRQLAPAERCAVLRKLQARKDEWRSLLIALVFLPPLISWGYEYAFPVADGVTPESLDLRAEEIEMARRIFVPIETY